MCLHHLAPRLPPHQCTSHPPNADLHYTPQHPNTSAPGPAPTPNSSDYPCSPNRVQSTIKLSNYQRSVNQLSVTPWHWHWHFNRNFSFLVLVRADYWQLVNEWALSSVFQYQCPRIRATMTSSFHRTRVTNTVIRRRGVQLHYSCAQVASDRLFFST